MTDHLGAADDSDGPPATPDYELADRLDLTEVDEYRALFQDTRLAIVGVLSERAATTSDLAEVLGVPKGTIGHHLKVLEQAGLVRVVRTRRVRAIEAKYYGRTARTFYFDYQGDAIGAPQRILSAAASELATAQAAIPPDGSTPLARAPVMANIRYVRIPSERAQEWSSRLEQFLNEFSNEPRDGDVTFAMVVGVYPTTRPPLRPTTADDRDEQFGEHAVEGTPRANGDR